MIKDIPNHSGFKARTDGTIIGKTRKTDEGVISIIVVIMKCYFLRMEKQPTIERID